MSDDFCITHGYSHMKSRFADPIPYCEACECEHDWKLIMREAVIEECAKVAEAQAQTFLSPQYASNQPVGSICERFACEEVAKAIRALTRNI